MLCDELKLLSMSSGIESGISEQTVKPISRLDGFFSDY